MGPRRRMARRAAEAIAAAAAAAVLAAGAQAAPAISPRSAKIEAGTKTKLRLVGTKAKAKWRSSDPKVAKVSSKGVATGVKAGKATITATVGKKKARCVVTVTAKARKVSLSAKKKTAYVGTKFTLKASVTPKGAKVKWTSSDPKVAKVSSKGVVTCLKAGKATIRATAASNPKARASCVVTSKAKKKTSASGGASALAATSSYDSPKVDEMTDVDEPTGSRRTRALVYVTKAPALGKAACMGGSAQVEFLGNSSQPFYQFQISRSPSFGAGTKSFSIANGGFANAIVWYSAKYSPQYAGVKEEHYLKLWNGDGSAMDAPTLYSLTLMADGKAKAAADDAYFSAGYKLHGGSIDPAIRDFVKECSDRSAQVASLATGADVTGWYVRARSYVTESAVSGWSNVAKIK